jgi:hypothetical protein
VKVRYRITQVEREAATITATQHRVGWRVQVTSVAASRLSMEELGAAMKQMGASINGPT